MGVKVRQKVKGKGNPWWVFVSHQGRRTSRKVGAKTAAEKAAREIEARLTLGDFNFEKASRVPLFKDFAQTFLETYSAVKHKPSTHNNYASAIEHHLDPVFGNMPIDKIRRKHIIDFLTRKQLGHLSPASVRNLKAYLSSIFTLALDQEIITANPAARTGKAIVKTDQTASVDPLTWEEKAAFEESARKHFPQHAPLFLTALRTGMRLGELLALQPGDLDFNSEFIAVRRTAARGQIGTPKSGKSRRVDMSSELKTILKAQLTQRKRDTLKNGWKEQPEWLFYNANGNLLDVNNLRKRVFDKILEKAGLRQIRIHDLRHTYATLRIQAGHNIADVSKQLGHHGIAITVDTYYHSLPGANKSDIDALDTPKVGCA